MSLETSRERAIAIEREQQSARRSEDHPDEPSGEGPRGTRRPLALLAPVIPLIAIGAAWAFGALERLDSAEEVAAAGRALRDHPLAFLYVLVAFAVGTLLFIPITALIAGTALAFDAVHGFVYALAGALVGASTTYWGGRLLGSRALDYLSGPRLRRFSKELRTRAFRASIIARLLPVGNFTVINLLAGSLRVPFRGYFFGNVVGVLPGIIIICLFAEQLTSALRSPNAKNITLLTAAAVALIAFAVGLRWFYRRRTRTAELRGGDTP